MPSLRKMCLLPSAQLVLAPNLLFSCCAFCRMSLVSSTACSSARRNCLNGAISLYLALNALKRIRWGYPAIRPSVSQLKRLEEKKKKKERISKVKISKVTDQINLFLQGLFFKKEIKNLDEIFFFFFFTSPIPARQDKRPTRGTAIG